MLYRTENPHGGDVWGGAPLLDFSANTNPLGTPPGVLDAIRAALPALHRYPDPYCRALVGAISEFEAVPEEWILCGNGAAELIYAYCQAVRPGLAVELAPTFSEYALALERLGGRMARYPLKKEREFALGEDFLSFLERVAPEAVFLCNPNNPTGKTVSPRLMEQILALCQRNGANLFVDECFLPLSDSGESLKPWLSDHPELCILKAFTKSYGMAGIRLGYCLSGNGGLLSEMSGAVQPWNVSSLAQAAGVAALRETEFLERTRALVFRERAWLIRRLEALGLWVCPSGANYLLFEGPPGLRETMLEKGIAIRDCGNYQGLGPGWYRVAVRLPWENRRLMAAMEEAYPWQKTL